MLILPPQTATAADLAALAGHLGATTTHAGPPGVVLAASKYTIAAWISCQHPRPSENWTVQSLGSIQLVPKTMRPGASESYFSTVAKNLSRTGTQSPGT